MDTAIFEAINGLAGHVDSIDDTAQVIAQYGPFALIAVLAALWFWPGERPARTRRQWAGVIATLSASTALGLNQIIIHLWDRPRPFIAHHATLLLAPSHDPSFPSDHATFAFAVAVALLLYRRRVALGALVVAILIAFSRVYTGEHYPGDVVAGAAVGSALAITLYACRAWIARVVEPLLGIARRLHLA